MKIDIAKSAIVNAFALINAANALTLDATKVTLGAPVARTPGANPRNTTLTLTAVVGQGYKDTVDVTYTRLGMGSGVAVPEFGFHTDGTTLLPAFKTAVATSLGLVEAEIDVTGDLPATEGSTTTMVVSAKAGSLLYIGTQDLTVDWPQGDVALADAVTVPDLDGFDPVTA